MNDWRSRCKMIGEKVKIIDDERTKFGIFEDIDDEGFMILRQGDFKEKIHYGDVNVR
jgi:BirA family biotin operon repressor/biotin-[acetyl-CoA-carboxylase] ligase